MSHRQHLTTRRGFIATLGFGGVGLYGAWAAYGAAPLPFASSSEPAPAAAAHGGGHGGGGGMAPEEFMRRHDDFLARFKAADGSVVPRTGEPEPAATPATPQMPAGDHAGHGASPASAMPHAAGTAMDHGAPAAPDVHGGHAAPAHAASGHGGEEAAHADAEAGEATDVYLLAYRFGFAPDDLRLEAGRPYRFRMMASDVTHGASLKVGVGSRIIRLRPNVVSEQTITFKRPGPVLVYCTVYCGPAHDAMKGRILVA